MKKTPRNPDSFDPEGWRQADKVLDALLQIPESQRKTYLDGLELEPEVKERARRLAEMLEQPGLLDSEDVTWLGKLNALNAAGLEGRRFGPYQLQEQIGRGGMSSVYRAVRTDGAYDAAVAFKLLNPALLATNWQDRFQREARFLAELRHPGISCLLDAGVTEDGTPYLVTELIEGLPLDQYCDTHDLSIRERVALVAELCEAVAFAQSRLVVHRDIKADNVLVDQQGRVKLLDFGIARLLDDSGGSTRLPHVTYTRIFTPQYAAPEQLAGQPLTTATDVFGLGVVLYRLLTGHLPYTHEQSVGAGRESLTQPSRKVDADTDLERSRRQRRAAQLRGDLDNIIARALAEDPEHRYANAKELGRDLGAWLEHRPVQARRPSLVYRLRLFARRRRELAVALCALMIVAVGGLSATLWQAGEARVQAASAVEAGARAQAVSEFMLSLFEANDPDLSGTESVTAAELLEAGRLRASEAFNDLPDTRAELLLTMARLYQKLGDAEQTRTLLESSQVIDSGTPQQAAQAWLIHSNLALAEGEVQLALEAARAGYALLDERSPAALQVDLRLALTVALTSSGEIEAGVATARAALDFVERHPPATANLRLQVLNNLAGALYRLGDYDAALQAAEEAWALAQRGVGSPTLVFNTLSNHSIILSHMGRLEDSVTLMRQALNLTEETYPQAHRWRAKIAASLGNLLAAMGHYHEAELRMSESLAFYETIYPEPNLHSGAVYNNLGLMMLELERPADAVPRLETAVQVAIGTFGAQDLRTLSARMNQAKARSLLGVDDEVEAELLEICQLREVALGQQNPSVARCEGVLADHHLRNNRPQEAMKWADRAIARLVDSGPSESAIMPMTYRAAALAALNRSTDADAGFAQALEIAVALGVNAGKIHLMAADRYLAFLADVDPVRARELIDSLESGGHLAIAPDRPEVRRILAQRERLNGHAAH